MNLIKTNFSIGATIAVVSNRFAQTQPDEVSHTQNLCIQLVTRLRCKKGEKELNSGFNFKNVRHDQETALLVEDEYAPLHVLGFEVEADFSFCKRTAINVEISNHKWACLRLSTPYSCVVSTKL